jgi:phosphoglycolate phosphatase-like HAD superfamily hydrolase
LHHVMFDVDGTLVESFKFDEECYLDAVFRTLGRNIDTDWSKYPHISDSGILDHYLAKHDLLHHREETHAQVKSVFIKNIKDHLSRSPAKKVFGAAEFISHLQKQKNVSLSIATGGWGETARLKLASAGLDITGIPMASSNDHYSRIEIMKLALRKAAVTPGHKLTYFGDAEWDKKACEELQFNFVLVGNRIEHSQAVSDFEASYQACRFIGL